ncbi:glycosyltransferase family 4 protein [Shinella zoogloeoides]|uniref:glycosyltransferase family 4 protein n=1 Tax=Shinella zoogloeoides TaxID=352475 RepID=UPI001F5AD27D|nr:glycosyltransferase [Shinella zoogloeoides]
MKIVHIITGLKDGGAEATLYRLATYEHPGDHHLVVSLTDSGKYGSMLEAKGIPVKSLNMPKGRLTFGGLRQLWIILRQERPQIVQTWMFHANLIGGVVAKLIGGTEVYWGIHHTTLIPGTTGNSTRLVDWACARLSRYIPTKIIACGKKARDAHICRGYTAVKFTVIPNGYDVSFFCPDLLAREHVRRELSIAHDAYVVGTVGRWDPQKDHANLIAAIRVVREQHPHLHLVLAGSDCDKNNSELQELLYAAALLDNVHLLGRRTDVPAVMNALDLHVLPSYNEAFPNVVAEAMACGVPGIVTDVGDAKDIVGATGWVVPPREAQALANAITEALCEIRDTPNWILRKQQVRQRIEDNFSLQTMAENYYKSWADK